LRRNPPFPAGFWWAHVGSNHGPPACEAGALPLSYAPRDGLLYPLARDGLGFPQSTEEARMALARVVSFEGVSKDRMDEMNREMQDQEPPEGLNAKEMIVLHDADAERSLVVLFFDNEDDYRSGDEILSAMPTGDTPGQRTSVQKYDVAHRQTM